MKTTWLLIILLLVSVGLNAGLAWRLGRSEPSVGPDGGWTPPDRPGPGIDTPPDGPPPAEGDADPANPRVQRLMRERLDRLTEALDLTPEQREAFVAAQQVAAPQFFARRRAIGELRRELRELALAPDVDREAVLRRQQKLSAMQAELDSVVVESMVAEVRLLTPRQKEIYRDLVPWGAPSHGGPGHRGGGRGRLPR